jgi:hypothetical protein
MGIARILLRRMEQDLLCLLTVSQVKKSNALVRFGNRHLRIEPIGGGKLLDSRLQELLIYQSCTQIVQPAGFLPVDGASLCVTK